MDNENIPKSIARIEWHHPQLKRTYSVDLNYCICGSKKVKPNYEKGGGFWIECQQCRLFSEQHETLSAAVKEWNKLIEKERRR